ncbi:acyltransferase [Rheinheimera riviphila]|uniref:acyltransferase n=1 Tax=Rheinheimera riviphila TaxID=1834037 RepID=UPI0013E37D10|nr:acyltransferase [Rheinheimera riviphila]
MIIGDDCGFSATVISAGYSIRIGDRVMCGANVTITDSDRHPLAAAARHAGQPGVSAAVIIEDDVWLGMNVLVLKGVTIGKGAVVAANSVVSQNIPSYSLAAGVPARALPGTEVTP